MSALKVWWQRYGLTALLGTAAVAGLGAVGVETDWGRNMRAVSAPQGSGDARTELTPTVPPFKLGELDVAFKESGERPLFTPTRRPPQATQNAAVPQMKRGQFKLAGTVVNQGMSVAYLVEVANNKTLRVTKGAEILGQPGLTVDTVDATRVVLKLGDETEILELRTAPSPPKPAVPPGTPQGTQVAGQPVPVVGLGQPAGVPATAVVTLPAGQNAPSQPVLPGFSAGQGFVPRAAGAPPQAPAATDAQATNDANTAAQRRRRFQNFQQPAPQQ